MALSYIKTLVIAQYNAALASGRFHQAFSLHHLLRGGDRPASIYQSASLDPIRVRWFFNQRCSICFEGFEGEVGGPDQPWFIPCGHCFHRECIVSWMVLHQPTCPLCHRRVNSGGLITPMKQCCTKYCTVEAAKKKKKKTQKKHKNVIQLQQKKRFCSHRLRIPWLNFIDL